MKTSLEEILDRCSAEEVEMFMKDFELEKNEAVQSERIYQKALKKSGIAQKGVLRVIAVSAACIAIAAVGITAGISMKNNPVPPVIDSSSSQNEESEPTTEKAEYEKALKYCQDNDIFIEGLSEDDVSRVYKNVSSSAFISRSDETSDECRQFIDNFIANYDKEVPADGEEILRWIFDSYSGVNLTQKQCEAIYEHMLQEKEEDEFVDKFISYYMDKHSVSSLEDFLGSDFQEGIAVGLFYRYYGSEMTMEQYEQEYEKALQRQKECTAFVSDMMSHYTKGTSFFAVDSYMIWAEIYYHYGDLNLTREQYEQIYENFENPFKQAVIAGIVDENTPYITLEQVNEIIAGSNNAQEVYQKMCAIRPPDRHFVGSGVYGGATFTVNEHESIYCEYGYISRAYGNGVVSVQYSKTGNDGQVLAYKQLFPIKEDVSENENEPVVAISEPKKVGNSYEVTVTSDTKEPFKLVLEESVAGKNELYKKTVIMIDGQGTFETENAGTYKPVSYFIGGVELSEENVKGLVRGYSDIKKDGQTYKKVQISFSLDLSDEILREHCDLIYDIVSDTGEILEKSDVVEYYRMNNRVSAEYTCKVSDKNQDVNVKVIPRYILSNNERYFSAE